MARDGPYCGNCGKTHSLNGQCRYPNGRHGIHLDKEQARCPVCHPDKKHGMVCLPHWRAGYRKQ